MSGALKGVRVLDLTQMMAGPFCTMLLADQGADVIKIEPPEGEATRTHGPHFADDQERHYGGYFQSINRNKRSICLDLKSQGGKQAFRSLAAGADVVIENFRAGVMDRLGLGFETLAAANPRLVYGAIRGFGDPRTGSSPYQDWPAYDIVAQAMGGIMQVTGQPDGPPTKIGPGVGDTIPAMLSAIGILSAVIHARTTGQGQFVDVAMVDGIFAICERAAMLQSYTGAVSGRDGNHHPMFAPFGTFPCSDGWVAVGCPKDHFWILLTEVMGQPELGLDPRYARNAERTSRREEVIALVTAWTLPCSKAELAGLIGGRVPFGPVNTVADLFADPHLAARGMLAQVGHAGSEQTATIANTPIRMTATPGGARQRAPMAGEHTDAVLAEAGLSESEIAALRAAGAVR
ncbi:MAG: CoA transferase [Proteobacteria bacterium]|nr:CoA transferase [Pseudomonadota bacterium]